MRVGAPRRGVVVAVSLVGIVSLTSCGGSDAPTAGGTPEKTASADGARDAASAAPAGTLVTSLSSSVLTDAGYGYLLTSDDDADTDFQALTRADGTQVPWWPLSPDVGEAEAHLFTPHGLLV